MKKTRRKVFSLRLEEDFKALLKAEAEKHFRSLNQEIYMRLKMSLGNGNGAAPDGAK